MTPILKIISEYCAVYVDDIRLSELQQTNPPLYARKMWGYFNAAISLFQIPANMQIYLRGTKDSPNIVEPEFNDYSYIASETYTSNITIELGNAYTGYELFSCAIATKDSNNDTVLTPFSGATYNSETGEVVIASSETNPVEQGTCFCFDFYSDGYFVKDLSEEIQSILGECFQVMWQDRFNTEWLSNVAKIEDKSFSEQNRANKTRADTERMKYLKQKLAGRMRRFEQNAEYNQKVYSGKLNF